MDKRDLLIYRGVLSLQKSCRVEVLLGAFAAKMFYFGCKLQCPVKKRVEY